MVQLLFDLFFSLTDLTQLLGSTVGNVEAAGTGVFGVQHRQRCGGIVEGKVFELRLLVHLLHQRDQRLHTLQIVFQFKQFHVVRGIAVLDAAHSAADLLHLAKEHTNLIVDTLELLAVAGSLLYVIQFVLQLGTLLGSIEAQTANLLDTEGAASVERFQRVLQTNFFSLFKTNGDHASSSFTLMTGTSTASLILRLNSSLSNFQP